MNIPTFGALVIGFVLSAGYATATNALMPYIYALVGALR